MNDIVYFDNQSTTKPDPRVVESMLPYLSEKYGNPQSMHSVGAEARDAIDEARANVAALINASSAREIIFTSSGSESNNLAIKGVAEAYEKDGRHIVVSSVEHFSVLNAARRLERRGYEVTQIGVDEYGTIIFEELEQSIRPDTILVSIQHANTEVGTIQPLKKIVEIVRRKNPKTVIHTDAVGTAGNIPVDVKELGIDLLSLAASQFYGPKGAAALFVKKGIRIIPQTDGGIQEEGRRAGTENVAAIVGMGTAAAIAGIEIPSVSARITILRNHLIDLLPKKIKYVKLNGHPTERLPGNVNFSIEFIEGEGMLLMLDAKKICASSGSACTSKALKLSHVLNAMKVDPAAAQGSLLFTLSKYNTMEEVEYALTELPPIVERLRSMSPTYAHFLKTGKRMAAGPGTDYEHHHDTGEE